MCSLLCKRAFSLVPSSHLTHHFHHHNHGLPLFHVLHHLSLSTQTQQSEEELPFLAQYLISSFGFSRDRAIKVSTNKNFRAIKFSDRPGSVVTFLKEIGLSDSQIRRVVSSDPSLLSISVEKTLKPQTRALMDAGCTREMLMQLIQSNRRCLYTKDTLSRLQFWRNFVGNSDDVLVKVLQRSSRLICFDVDNHAVPRINLLQEFGLSNQQIVNLLMRGQRIMLRSLETLREILERTEELGFLRGSARFMQGLRVFSCNSKETLDRKRGFFQRKYGWSEEDFSSALKKFPNIISQTEETIVLKMDFLINNAGFEPRCISHQPVLLSYSLSRLVPRHKILSALEAKAFKKSLNLLNMCVLSEKRFLDRFVLPYEKDLPGLTDAYVAACHAKVRAG